MTDGINHRGLLADEELAGAMEHQGHDEPYIGLGVDYKRAATDG